MRIRYVGSGDPSDNTECEAFGHTFVLGEWVEMGNLPLRLLGNPTFEVDVDGDGTPEPDVATMKAQLDALGVRYHHKAGARKLAELLAAAQADT